MNLKGRRLRIGDVIQFDDVIDASFARTKLQKMGIETRYLLERKGKKGIWLEITKRNLTREQKR